MFKIILQYIDIRRLTSKELGMLLLLFLCLFIYLATIVGRTQGDAKIAKKAAKDVPNIGLTTVEKPDEQQMAQFSQLFAIEPTALVRDQGKAKVQFEPRLQDKQPKLLAVASIDGTLFATVKYQKEKNEDTIVTVRVNEKVATAIVTSISPQRVTLVDSDETPLSLMLFSTPSNQH